MPLSLNAVAVNFPSMRPELVAPELRAALRFFDPGVNGGEAALLRPEGLPFGKEEIHGVLKQYDSLGEGVKSPRDLETLRSMLYNDFFSETSHAIMGELKDRQTPGRPEAMSKRLIKAQTLLCLACKLEERVLELGGLRDGVAKSWDALGKTLGLEEDDELADSVMPGSAFTPQVAFEDDFRIPWAVVLESMLAFMPENIPLCLSDPAIAEFWADRGLGLETISAAALAGAFRNGSVPSGTYLVGNYPGYRLALSNRPCEDKPWLDAHRVVIFRTPAEV